MKTPRANGGRHWLSAGVGVALLLSSGTGQGAQTIRHARAWVYLNTNLVVQPWLALTAMPGLRYEAARAPGDAGGLYMTELFIGPTFIHRGGPLTIRLGTWYYYTGFNLQPVPDKYYYTNSLEVLPIVDYRIGNFTLTTRTIFHNTLYATAYEPSHRQKVGYSLVIRELLQVKYDALKELGIVLADEPFFGVIEDKDTSGLPLKLNSVGYWPQGLRLNRLYAGIEWRPGTPGLAITPLYVYETAINDNLHLTDASHYLFLTISYSYKAYHDPPPPN